MDNNDLKRRIEALEKWKAEKIAQQISYPLDNQSQIILNKYFLAKTNDLYYQGGAGGKIYKEIFAQQNGQINSLPAEYRLIKYVANTSADTLTLSQDVVNLEQGSLSDGNTVIPASTSIVNGVVGTPTFNPLGAGGVYYVVNATVGGTVIQLSDTMGGLPVDVQSTGTGDQYLIIV